MRGVKNAVTKELGAGVARPFVGTELVDGATAGSHAQQLEPRIASHTPGLPSPSSCSPFVTNQQSRRARVAALGAHAGAQEPETDRDRVGVSRPGNAQRLAQVVLVGGRVGDELSAGGAEPVGHLVDRGAVLVPAVEQLRDGLVARPLDLCCGPPVGADAVEAPLHQVGGDTGEVGDDVTRRPRGRRGRGEVGGSGWRGLEQLPHPARFTR